MAIEKIRLAICDTRHCQYEEIHVKDKLPQGWKWWYIGWPVGGGQIVKVETQLPGHSYSLRKFLLCPTCSESKEIPNVNHQQ